MKEIRSTRIEDHLKGESLSGRPLNIMFATGYDVSIQSWFFTVYINDVLLFNYFPFNARLSSLDFRDMLKRMGLTLDATFDNCLGLDDGYMTDVTKCIIGYSTIQAVYKECGRLRSLFPASFASYDFEFYSNKFAKFIF